nr:MAG TPA: protein of unknown function (DUF5055) [Caudoviricetes sp.]
MIEFDYNDKHYKLTFTRETAKMAEQKGFSPDGKKIEDMPATQLDILFHMAFKANHPSLSDKKINEIIALLGDKKGIIVNLMEDLGRTYESLLGEPDEKNAIKWESA